MRLAFRIVAGVFGVFVLGTSIPFAIGSFVDDAQDIHLIHNLSGAAVYGVLLGVGLVALAARPEGYVAILQGLVLASVGALIGGLLAGDLIEGFWFIVPVFVLILIALDPARTALTSVGTVNPPVLVLVVAAAIPLVAYALTQASLQANGSPLDPHVEAHHYGGQAVGSLLLLLFAVAPALGAAGWRLAAWLVGVSMATIALGSLAYADHVSALDSPWAWLALAWAIAYVAVAEASVRRRQPVAVG
ncbi:MAG TPA: hypothetical protein VKC55_07525 [Actinomycetota bacterium]|nr:hypothetical protein [Actinomycetota bacterium]